MMNQNEPEDLPAADLAKQPGGLAYLRLAEPPGRHAGARNHGRVETDHGNIADAAYIGEMRCWAGCELRSPGIRFHIGPPAPDPGIRPQSRIDVVVARDHRNPLGRAQIPKPGQGPLVLAGQANIDEIAGYDDVIGTLGLDVVHQPVEYGPQVDLSPLELPVCIAQKPFDVPMPGPKSDEWGKMHVRDVGDGNGSGLHWRLIASIVRRVRWPDGLGWRR